MKAAGESAASFHMPELTIELSKFCKVRGCNDNLG